MWPVVDRMVKPVIAVFMAIYDVHNVCIFAVTNHTEHLSTCADLRALGNYVSQLY